MSIRFHCGSCSQPIEVDDEWASKTVACPFCRNTINAPAASSLDQPSEFHVASPLTTDANSDQPLRRVQPLPSPNRIAIVAFALACSLILLMLANAAIIAPHTLELTALQDQVREAAEKGQSSWDVMTAYINERGGVTPNWLIGLSLTMLAMMGVWIAAVVCGIIGVLRPIRRRFAVTALIICGGFVVQECMGTLFG